MSVRIPADLAHGFAVAVELAGVSRSDATREAIAGYIAGIARAEATVATLNDERRADGPGDVTTPPAARAPHGQG